MLGHSITVILEHMLKYPILHTLNFRADKMNILSFTEIPGNVEIVDFHEI